MLKPEAQIEIARTMRWTASNPDTRLPADLAGEVPQVDRLAQLDRTKINSMRAGVDRSLEPGNSQVTVAAAGSPRRSRFHGSLVPVLLFAPCALIYAVFFIWPQAALLAISTSDKSGFTLQHYGRFFGDLYYWEMLGRTLGMGVAVTAITLILGVPTAYVLARLQSRWAGFLLLLTTFPLLVSAVVRSFGWMVLFFKDGLVSRTLVLLGVADRPVQLMYTMSGVIIALAQVLLPMMVLTLYGVFKSIDRDLEYAAMKSRSPAFGGAGAGHLASRSRRHRRGLAAGVLAGDQHLRHAESGRRSARQRDGHGYLRAHGRAA